MADSTELRWALFQDDLSLPVTTFGGIRWQWHLDKHSGQHMWFAINWVQAGGTMATQVAQPVVSAIAEASGHQSEASVIASVIATIFILIAIVVRQC